MVLEKIHTLVSFHLFLCLCVSLQSCGLHTQSESQIEDPSMEDISRQFIWVHSSPLSQQAPSCHIRHPLSRHTEVTRGSVRQSFPVSHGNCSGLVECWAQGAGGCWPSSCCSQCAEHIIICGRREGVQCEGIKAVNKCISGSFLLFPCTDPIGVSPPHCASLSPPSSSCLLLLTAPHS